MGRSPSQVRYHEKMKNDPEYREDRARRRRISYRKLKDEVIAAYGGKCACCGEDTREFLVLDHVNGGGNKHRLSYGARNASLYIYREVRRNGYPGGFQVLCANCNLAKERAGGCPHQR